MMFWEWDIQQVGWSAKDYTPATDVINNNSDPRWEGWWKQDTVDEEDSNGAY